MSNPHPCATIEGMEEEKMRNESGLGDTAFARNRTEPLHRWVPWIAGFSSSFVGSVLETVSDRNPADILVLDPFAGVGTTLVEAMERATTRWASRSTRTRHSCAAPR